jgi:type III restriction enzyme
MRIPRDVPNAHIQQNYPVLTVTNHDKFADHIKELVDSVEGVETLTKVVEIKSDEEQDEATPAKDEYAKVHFERVNRKLSALNLADLESRYRSDAKQHYSFDLLTPHHFPGWIADLKSGKKLL